MKTTQTLGEQLVALKDREARKQREQAQRDELIKKYGNPIRPK